MRTIPHSKQEATTKFSNNGDEDLDEFARAFDAVDWQMPEVAADPNTSTKRAILETRRFDVSNPPPPAFPIYKICGKAICTPGNLTAVSAHIKSGKTAFVCACAAASFGIEGDTLGVDSSNLQELAVIHFDTEQSSADHYAVVSKALSRIAVKKSPDWFRSYRIADIDPKKRFELLEFEMRRANRKHGGIHSVLLDGAADFLKDVNNIEESMSRVARLHMLAIEYRTHIICVIHFNPGTKKTRGHFGSELARKAESNLILDKVQEIVTVSTESSRHAVIAKKDGPRFKWDKSTEMHLSCLRNGEVIKVKNKALEDLAKKVFEYPDQQQRLQWVDLIERIKLIEGCSGPTAGRRRDTLIEDKLLRQITKGNIKWYVLNAHK